MTTPYTISSGSHERITGPVADQIIEQAERIEKLERENAELRSLIHPDTEADGVVFCGQCGARK